MNLIHPLVLPGLPLVGVYGQTSVAMTPDGLTTVGWQLHDLGNLELLAHGCLPPTQRKDLPTVSQEVLDAVVCAGESLLDLPPFS